MVMQWQYSVHCATHQQTPTHMSNQHTYDVLVTQTPHYCHLIAHATPDNLVPVTLGKCQQALHLHAFPATHHVYHPRSRL
jgi:hypothetical protein